MENNSARVIIPDTQFIFKTNFSGDPSRDTYGNATRNVNVILNDEDTINRLIDEGVKVRFTKPKDPNDDTFEPMAFVNVKIKYDENRKRNPLIYLVTGKKPPVLLDSDSIATLDKIYILKADVSANMYQKEGGDTVTLYADTIYVTQDLDEDPFYSKYSSGYDED